MLKRIKRSGVLYVVPALLIIAVVMLYPLLYTLVMGFFKNTIYSSAPEFVGFGQYAKLFKDTVFLGSIKSTFVWTIGSVVFQFSLGFLMALIINRPFLKGRVVWRTLLMIPWVLPSVIGSSIWKLMYNADYGIINYLLKTVGLIDSNRTWLSNPSTAMAAVIAVNVWKMFPFVLLMVEAALQNVSQEIKEAAVIDGAGSFRIFQNVTWPSISTTCYSIILLLTIWTLNAFTFIYTLTEGGPAHRTEVLAMFIYKKAFTEYDFGIASAGSTVLFVISMVFALFYIRFTQKQEDMA